MKRIFIVIFMQVGFVLSMYAQGEFIPRGTNAFSGSMLMCTDKEANAIGVQAGYSYKGFFDVGLMYLKATAGDFKSGILSPSITYFIVKQEDAVHVPTIGMTFHYQHYTSTTTSTVVQPDSLPALSFHTKEITKTQTLDAFVFDITAHKRVGYWNVFFFQPMLGGGVAMTRVDWNVCLRGGVEIGTRMVRGPLMIISPWIEYRSSLTSFIVKLQAVF